MAKPVADANSENQGGFSTDASSAISGFSHMHDSGTGGVSILFYLWFKRTQI
jgi:putative alpha-1,2-mannosidase